MADNNIQFLLSIIERLKHGNLPVWLFGGWAEELLELAPSRKHRDIDFLYRDDNFLSLERWATAQNNLREITQKRFAHKRAYELEGIMIEFTLVKNYKTNFFDAYKFTWPKDTFDTNLTIYGLSISIASIKSLNVYRNSHKNLNYARAISDGLIGAPL